MVPTRSVNSVSRKIFHHNFVNLFVNFMTLINASLMRVINTMVFELRLDDTFHFWYCCIKPVPHQLKRSANYFERAHLL